MKRRRGVTLVELLVVAAMGVLIAVGTVRAFESGLDFQTRLQPQRKQQTERFVFEERLGDLISHAYLGSDAESTQTYFVLESTGASGGLGNGDLPDRLTLSVKGLPISAGTLESTDDFETRNERFGPQGGISEASLSTTPIAASSDVAGVFLRRQNPSDGDLTQGGFESVFWNRVGTIGFEVHDGQQWGTIWDTTQMDERRLPAAVRVSYTLDDDSETTYRFTVRLPLSDVTADDPASARGAN